MQPKQYVGIDLHRRRSVIVLRSTEGETLDVVRVDNDNLLAFEKAVMGLSRLCCSVAWKAGFRWRAQLKLTRGHRRKARVAIGLCRYHYAKGNINCSLWEGTLTDEIITALQHSEMFRDLPSKELRRIRDAGKELSFPSGSQLVVEGEEAGRFFLILAGSAEVSLKGKSRATLGPGMSLGEIALLDGEPRSATVTAVTDVRTFSLTSWNFRPFLAEESVMQVVIQLLCKRLRSAEESAYS